MGKLSQISLNRISFAAIAIATITLLSLCLSPPPQQTPTTQSDTWHQFPTSSCDAASRRPTTIEKRNHRLWSTHTWQSQVASYGKFFSDLGLIQNRSKVLCVSAGAGHAAAALRTSFAGEVAAVEVLESPPLVRRADPHSLPFADASFDVAFNARLADALAPARVADEMERVVVPGGACVVAAEECGDVEVREIAGLFGKSEFVGSLNVSLIGLRMTRIVVKRNNYAN